MDKVNFCAFGIYMINFVILRLQFLNYGKRQETGRTYCMLYGICDIRNQYNRMQRHDGGTSDLTYRIYDYGRLGLDGKPRALHTELAAQALDYRVYKEYKNSYKDAIDTANPCLDTEHFSVRVVSLTQAIHRNMVGYDSFVIQTSTKGACTIRIRSTQDEIRLEESQSCLIPAAIADYDLIPTPPEVKLLESYIDNSTQRTFRRMISQFLHISGM